MNSRKPTGSKNDRSFKNPHLEGLSEEGPSESDNPESDLKRLEQLFKKVQNQYGLDKVKLVKSLLESGYQQPKSYGKGKNILSGIIKNDHSSRQEDTSMD